MVLKYAPQDPALAAFIKPAAQPAPPAALAAPSPEPSRPQPPAPAASPPPATTGKTLVSLRIDTDLLAAFKANGKGWQTRINATLRTAVGK
ncbi:BrnA antitoxin family protein [Mesorhizobium sp. WSM2561]|uniref:BrnA antitoxin family protein n=1 Tax=Mesorhizobium sp. WSM2561 TaxID=1040985 RepID=UPI0004B9F20D|nr:BrnA antitoxin family protein [Mesorhizobium sp. WSM2561]